MHQKFRTSTESRRVFYMLHKYALSCGILPTIISYIYIVSMYALGAIQVLRNADGGRGVSDFPKKSVTMV